MAEGSARGHSALFLSPRTSELRQSVISYGSDQVDGATVVPPGDVPVSHSGILQKIGRKLKLWKSRYFEVQEQQVYYYKTERKRHCLGAVDLKICYHVAASDAANFGYAFEVQTTARTHLFAARTEADRQKWIDVITEKMGGKAVYEASKSTLTARTKTGRRPRGERNRTAENFPVMRREEEEASPTNLSPETKRKSRVSKLVTRITSFKASSRIGRSQRPLSYHPPARPSIEPVGEPQKPPVMKEQTVQVEVAPGKDTAATTPAQDDTTPPNIVVKEPTPTPQEENPPDEGGVPQHEGGFIQEGGTEPLEGNHVEPHPVVESPKAKPHPLHAAHTASSDREPSAPRDEPALHVDVQQEEEESVAAETAAVETRQEGALVEGETTVAAPLSTESANQEEVRTAAIEREVEHTAATTQEPPASHSRAEPTDEVPTKPTDEVPTEPTDEVPTEPTDEVPTKPTDEVPTKPTDEVPTEPTDEMPTKPTDEVPTEPTDEVHTEPTDEVPTEPTDEVPTEPTDEVPTKPTDEVPTKPTDEVPTKHIDEVPTKPTDDVRTKPTANMPTKTSTGIKRYELPTVPTMPTLPADVREYLSQRFAADEIKEHLVALSSEGEEPEDLPLPPMYRSFSISCDHDDDYAAPAMDELRLFLADCA